MLKAIKLLKSNNCNGVSSYSELCQIIHSQVDIAIHWFNWVQNTQFRASDSVVRNAWPWFVWKRMCPKDDTDNAWLSTHLPIIYLTNKRVVNSPEYVQEIMIW